MRLLALRDHVLITEYASGDVLHDGIVEDVPPNIEAMEPHAIIGVASDYYGYDGYVQIEVV